MPAREKSDISRKKVKIAKGYGKKETFTVIFCARAIGSLYFVQDSGRTIK